MAGEDQENSGRCPDSCSVSRTLSVSSSGTDGELSGSSNQSEAPSPCRPLPPPHQVRPDRTTLAANFTTTWNNYDDLELQHLIVRRYMEVNPQGRPSMDQVRERVVDVLRLVGSRLTPRDAIILVLQAGLNAALAVRQYMQNRHPRMATAVAEARNPPSPEKIAIGKNQDVH